ncbi:MAG: site-specific integrase [Lachnospiraceae bacterium]|nr:site-specific integrase [Lachnospiraceae bacterium]
MEKVKFEDWAITWVEQKKDYVKESTYANYIIALKNHLIPRLGSYPVDEITQEMVQTLILYLRRAGRVDGGGGLSDKTVRDMIMILKMCLKDFGVADKKIYRPNAFQYPVDSHISPIEVLNDDTLHAILQASEKEEGYEAIGYVVSLFTGMRIGEICALQWKDIDLEQKIIRVTKTLQRVYFKEGDKGKTKLVIGTPKSKAAIREIPIAHFLEKSLLNAVCNEDFYLLSGNYKPIEPRLYRKHFQDFLEKNNLKHIRFHALRHTFATRCIEKGGDYKTVSCLLGHSSIELTLKQYVHPQMAQKRKCVELANVN